MTQHLISDLELTARQILKDASDRGEWSSARQCILSTFRAMWGSSLPVEKIILIGEAMHGVVFQEGVIQAQLTKLVREKTLRSRRDQGQKLYEINY